MFYHGWCCEKNPTLRPFSRNYGAEAYSEYNQMWISLQTHHMYSTFKRCGSGRFHVVSAWNTLDVPTDTGRKLNVHKTLRRRPERLLNVLRAFSLRPVSTVVLVGILSLLIFIGKIFFMDFQKSILWMDQVKLFKGCLSQIILGPFLNTLSPLKPCQTSRMELYILDV